MALINDTVTDLDLKLLVITAKKASASLKKGNHPFGALLADENGKILLEAENTVISEHKSCGHAETNLMLKAVKLFEGDFLAKCTIYTTVEPCVMCSGAIYWGNVGRVVYGIDESQLLILTGSNPENLTFDLPCREVFSKGQKDIHVAGPTTDQKLIDTIVTDHSGFW